MPVVTDDLQAQIEQIRGTWDQADPPTLCLPGDRAPVVADVDGELRTFHSGLLYPARIDVEAIAAYCEEHGAPRIEPLSEAGKGRFDKAMFEWDIDHLPEET